MRRTLALLLLSLGTAACRPREPRPAPPSQPAAPVSAAAHRARGLTALDAGQYHLARAAFAASLAAAPDNLASLALLDAATQALLASQSAAAEAFARVRPTVVAAPPPRATVVREAPVSARPSIIKLVQVRVTVDPRPDDSAWLRDHDAELPELEVPNPMRGEPGNLPPGVAPLWGTHVLVQAISRPPHTILFYGPDYRGGRHIAVLAGNRRLGFLDLTACERPATWAEVADGVLLVTLGDDDTAYVAALELTTGELLWRSEPGVASAANFVVHGAHLLTARDDALFVLDRRTGATLATHPLTGSPQYLLVRGRRLAVRTDAADHEFVLTPPRA